MPTGKIDSPMPERGPSDFETMFNELHRLLTVTEDAFAVIFPGTAFAPSAVRTTTRVALISAVLRMEEIASQVERVASIVGPVQD